MRNRLIALLFVLALLPGAWSCAGRADIGNGEVAVLETTYGRIVIEFFPRDAPKHVANFKELTQSRFYDGTKIFRLVKNKDKGVACQGGDPNTINGDPSTWGQGQPGQPTVPREISKRLRHVRGVVSAARKNNEPDGHNSQFFICTSAYSQWDGEYSIFGRVIEGMNVVDAIVNAPVWPGSDRPLDPVVVTRAFLAKKEDLGLK